MSLLLSFSQEIHCAMCFLFALFALQCRQDGKRSGWRGWDGLCWDANGTFSNTPRNQIIAVSHFIIHTKCLLAKILYSILCTGGGLCSHFYNRTHTYTRLSIYLSIFLYIQVCKATNQFGEQRVEIRLHVKVVLSVHIHPQVQIVNSGGTAVFNCSIAGIGAIAEERIDWYHDGTLLQDLPSNNK